MISEYGGLFYLINESLLNLANVQVTNVKVDYAPALIYNLDSEMHIENCSFTNFNSTGIEVSTSSQPLNILNSNFTNGGTSIDLIQGGVLKLSKCRQLEATGNRFENMIAYQGGGMYFDIIETWGFTIANNTFTNCTAT